MPPTFSTLHAKQDAVLVCTKKDGVIENFDYVPMENVLVNGVSLAEFMKRHTEENAAMKAEVKLLNDRITRFVEIFNGGTVK